MADVNGLAWTDEEIGEAYHRRVKTVENACKRDVNKDSRWPRTTSTGKRY